MSAMSESIDAEKITSDKSYWFRINQQLVENLATRQASVFVLFVYNRMVSR